MEYNLSVIYKKEPKMKPKLYPITFFALILLLASCKSAKKLYEKGDYDEAVEKAAKKLQKDPHDQKLLSLVRESYSYASADHQNEIRSHNESNNELKWEGMYREYRALQRMYDALYRVPSVFTVINPVDYTSYLVTYSEKAADVRYDRGLALLQAGYSQTRNGKQYFRDAYREFQHALQYKPGHRDITQKVNEAYENAVTNVVILPMQQYGGFNYSGYSHGGHNFDDQLIRSLQYSSGNDFVRFYSGWDARNRNIRTDQVLDMRLSTFNIGRYHDQRSSRRVSKEVVIRETVYRPDSIVKEYAWVHADIMTTRRSIQSQAMLQVNVRDDYGAWLWNDHFNADHNWTTEFASYTGDQRALSESDKQLVNRGAQYPPDEQEITRQLLQQVSNDAVYRIKNYFGRM